MAIIVPQEAIDLIRSCDDAILLGIITQGRIKLTIADPVKVPGHVPWLRREPAPDVSGGFSLFVRGGLMEAFFRMSELNGGVDPNLSIELAWEICRQLPSSPNFESFEM